MSNKKAETLARVVEAAARIFSERPFEEVSIREIAATAHCSLATIYEAFGAKQQLFESAWLHNLSGPSWSVREDSNNSPLLDLMEFFTQRIVGLTRLGTLTYLNSSRMRNSEVRRDVDRKIERNAPLGAIVDKTRNAIQAELLRPGDPEKVAYLLMAGAGFEPVMYTLLFGAAAVVDTRAILDNVFSPLVTSRGQEELGAYLERLPTLADQASGPSLASYLHQAGGNAQAGSTDDGGL
jgi:AcrR family transcriptional regulator